jgi:hypothetical protein
MGPYFQGCVTEKEEKKASQEEYSGSKERIQGEEQEFCCRE